MPFTSIEAHYFGLRLSLAEMLMPIDEMLMPIVKHH